MNKLIYLGLSILENGKTVMHEFLHDYIELKDQDKANLNFMDTDSFIVNIKTDNVYKDIANDVEKRFDTSNYEIARPIPKGKIKKVFGLMKDELDVKIMTEFVGPILKTFYYLKYRNGGDKKAKGTKK